MSASPVAAPLKVDVWSDIACPWCYVGKRRFAEGARRYAERGGRRPVRSEYHSFELAPDTPVDFEGNEVDFLARFKGIPVASAEQMLAQMTATAAGVGLDYDFAALRHTKTLKAHELLHVAKTRGLQEEMTERLMSAYFTEGRHVGHVDELADLAAEVGLDRATVVDALLSGTYAAAVEADIDQAHRYGINGVPFYVIDGKYGISGAQDPETFARALAEVAAEQA